MNTRSHPFVVSITILIAVTIIAVLVPSGDSPRFVRDADDLGVYWERTTWVAAGGSPYREPQEYPLLGVLFIALPRLLVSAPSDYAPSFHVLTAIVFAGLLVVTAGLLARFGHSPWRLLLLCLPASLYFGLNRFDVLPALLVSASLLALLDHRSGLAGALLAMSVFAKLYSVLFFPFVLLFLLQKDRPAAKRFVFAVVAVGTIGLAVTFGLAGSDALFPFFFHGSRQVEAATFVALPALALLSVGAGPWIIPAITLISHLSLIGVAAGTTLRAARRRIENVEELVRRLAILALLVMIAIPFTSPQWILWIVPLLILLPLSRSMIAALILFDLATYLIFPVSFEVFGLTPTAWVPLTAIRLLAILFIVYRLIRRPPTAIASVSPVTGYAG